MDTGLRLAEQAGNSLQRINESIRDVAAMIRETAAATHEQAATSRAISGRIDGIAQTAQETQPRCNAPQTRCMASPNYQGNSNNLSHASDWLEPKSTPRK